MINVLSLFDGMSCIHIALQKLGISVGVCYASEIEPQPIKATMHNFPNTIQLGDVRGVHAKDLPKIDLLCAGSPCQGFSFAGKQLAFDDPRSSLFFEFIRILNEVRAINPDVVFLLENVRMKKEHEDVISRVLEIQPLNINSNLVSAQNRERLYWTNIATQKVGLFGDNYCSIPQPKDKGIFLRDILELEVDEKYYLSDKAIAGCMGRKISHKEKGNGFGATIADLNSKTNCITSRYGKDGAECLINEPVYGSICLGRTEEAKKQRKESMQKGKDYSPFQAKEISHIDYNKSNTVTCTPTKYNLILQSEPVKEVIQLNPSTESKNSQPYQQNRVYSINGLSPALCVGNGSNSGFGKILVDGYRIRRLTEIEVCRLQTVPDEYFLHPEGYVPPKGKQYTIALNGKLRYLVISGGAIYKACGNGWTVDAIAHILSYSRFFKAIQTL